MKKRLLLNIFILANLLSVCLLFRPQIASNAANYALLCFDQINPEGDIYQGDTVRFGGTIFNNETEPHLLDRIEVLFYNETNRTIPHQVYQYQFQENQPMRNLINPLESRTEYFEQEIGEEIPQADNYTLQMYFYYHEEGSAPPGDTETLPNTQIGNNATINVLFRREDAPSYVYAILVLLLLAIISFIVVGVVSKMREKKS
jgi:hypothetical protein